MTVVVTAVVPVVARREVVVRLVTTAARPHVAKRNLLAQFGQQVHILLCVCDSVSVPFPSSGLLLFVVRSSSPRGLWQGHSHSGRGSVGKCEEVGFTMKDAQDGMSWS
jgi:hypothetical protein